jgi:hypothetical protein
MVIGAPLACSVPMVIHAAITSANPVQTGRLFRAGVPGVCGQSSPACAATNVTTTYQYQQFNFNNPGPDAQCVSATIDATACTGDLYNVAYQGAFDPNNICTNYLSQMGHSTGGLFTYSFMAPAGANYSIVNNLVDRAFIVPPTR